MVTNAKTGHIFAHWFAVLRTKMSLIFTKMFCGYEMIWNFSPFVYRPQCAEVLDVFKNVWFLWKVQEHFLIFFHWNQSLQTWWQGIVMKEKFKSTLLFNTQSKNFHCCKCVFLLHWLLKTSYDSNHTVWVTGFIELFEWNRNVQQRWYRFMELLPHSH